MQSFAPSNEQEDVFLKRHRSLAQTGHEGFCSQASSKTGPVSKGLAPPSTAMKEISAEGGTTRLAHVLLHDVKGLKIGLNDGGTGLKSVD